MTVFINIDFNIAVCRNLLDHLSALSDDLANLVYRNLDLYHLRRILCHMVTRLCNCLCHYFVQNVQTSLTGLFKRFTDDLRCQTVNLDVHLNCRDALLGAADLEVHIAEEVFQTLNVHHGLEFLTVGESD